VEVDMSILQQTTPETTPYMIAGYAVIFGVLILYLLSLAIRKGNMKQDLDVLEELDKGGHEQN
jgi:hypothetical protein